MFNAGLREFITGKTPSTAYGSLYQPSTKDSVLTLPEMLGIDRQSQLATTTGGQTYRIGSVKVDPGLQAQKIKENLMANGFTMMGQVIAIVIVATMVIWMGAQYFGSTGALTTRYLLLIDLAALGALAWALINAFGIWRSRQRNKD